VLNWIENFKVISHRIQTQVLLLEIFFGIIQGYLFLRFAMKLI